MPSQTIQWFPGHTVKARRLIRDNLPSVDIVIEILDARIPLNSENTKVTLIVCSKPLLLILNISSFTDQEIISARKRQLIVSVGVVSLPTVFRVTA